MYKLLPLALLGFVASSYGQTINGNSCIGAGAYTLCNNLWGASSGVGGQSSTLNGANGNSVAWATNWNWQNNQNNVKSYANVVHNSAKGVQLASVASAPSSWNWYYQSRSNPLRADVAYDIWLGWAASGNPASSASSYEIMIWLSGQGGVQPIGGQIVGNLSLAGHRWNLWRGPNANWQVLSFVSAEGDITNFNGDLNQFFQYLVNNQGVSQWQYIQSIQAGTEPFTGAANLITNNYSVAVNRK